MKDHWCFGYLAYPFGFQFESVPNQHDDSSFVGYNSWFLKPKTIITSEKSDARLRSNEIFPPNGHVPFRKYTFKSTIRKEDYIKKVEEIRELIRQGVVYEMNLCIDFVVSDSSGLEFNPYAAFKMLYQAFPNPFSAFIKHDDFYTLCFSPERYIRRTNDRVISQPIKGTIGRDKNDASKDDLLRQALMQSEKDKAENVMIVDLVRNDLAKVAEAGSVEVTDLFGVYRFPNVHQMISTVECKVKPEVGFSDIIKASFPMGSMTGAPKPEAMKQIARLESFNRGLFSGAIGYVRPNGDFDFNVVIRTLFYNAEEQTLRIRVGGAITWDSNPEEEWNECLTKISGFLNVMGAAIEY
jgi:para-aminobenzoate synthetase component 1